MHNLKKYIANNLKAYFKDENNNAKNSIAFSNNTRNNPIEDDEIMISFDVISLYTNIPKIDTLNIIKDYVNIFNSQFYQQTDGVAVRGPAFSITAEIYMQAHEGTAISTAIHPRKFGNNLLITFILFLNVRTWKTISNTLTIFIKILSLLWGRNIMEK